MITVAPLRHEHLQRIELQIEQKSEAAYFKSAAFFDAVTHLPTFQTQTVLAGNTVLACWGLQEIWPGRAVMWCLFSTHASKHMLGLHKLALRNLKSLTIKRLEAHIRTGFKAGEQWAQMLGFKHEGHMQAFFYTGDDAELYARINKTE